MNRQMDKKQVQKALQDAVKQGLLSFELKNQEKMFSITSKGEKKVLQDLVDKPKVFLLMMSLIAKFSIEKGNALTMNQLLTKVVNMLKIGGIQELKKKEWFNELWPELKKMSVEEFIEELTNADFFRVKSEI